jgi:hypothetical protein
MLAWHGREVLQDSRLVNMLHDWTRNEFADESELFLLAVNSGAAEQIRHTHKVSPKAVWEIAARFSEDYCIQNDRALETISLLVSLIRGKAPLVYVNNNEHLHTRWRKQKPAGEPGRKNSIIDINGGTFKNSDGKTITLSPYSIMDAPVSQLEYWSVAGDNPSYVVGAEYPVDGVHWYAALDFCSQKSIREEIVPCYVIDKTNPDGNNLSPLDLYRWKVVWLPSTKGWRLPTAGEWEYAYKISAAFTVNAGLAEWCWDFSGDLFGSRFYENIRVAFVLKKRQGRLEKLRAPAQGEGCRINVNKHRTNYGEKCFSYAGNYGFRLARSGV